MSDENKIISPENASPDKPIGKKIKGWLFKIISLAILIYGVYYGITRFWAVNEKQTAGVLQSYGQEGRIIVTYEGTILTQELIQDPESGLSVRRLPFSVDKSAGKALQDFLSANIGKEVKVWYKKYQKTFFWRGNSVYVIYKAEPLIKP